MDISVFIWHIFFRLKTVVCFTATAVAFAFLCPAASADASPETSKLLAQADRLFGGEKWSDAEKAFLKHAKETKDKPGALRFKAGHSADATARYAAWLRNYPNSKLRERASAHYTSAL